jgi:hypothetical protein
MIHLSPSDSSILTRVAQYERIPIDKRLNLLSNASPEAQEVGRILLNVEQTANAAPDVRAAAEAFKKWLASNRRLRPTRAANRRFAYSR